MVLSSVWPVLKSLPQIGDLVFARQILHRRDVHGKVGRAVGEGHAGGDRGPGVEHRGGDRRMILLHRLLELRRGRVHLVRREKNFRGATPGHDQSRDLRLLLETRDVVFDLERQVVFGLGFFDVRPIEALDVVVVKCGFHGLDAGEEFLGLGQIFGRKHRCLLRGLIRGVGEQIPAAEDDIFEPFEWNEILDGWRAALGPLAQANRSELSDGADRFCAGAAHQIHASHERRGHGTHSHGQYPELSFRWCNCCRPAHSEFPPFVLRAAFRCINRLGALRQAYYGLRSSIESEASVAQGQSSISCGNSQRIAMRNLNRKQKISRAPICGAIRGFFECACRFAGRASVSPPIRSNAPTPGDRTLSSRGLKAEGSAFVWMHNANLAARSATRRGRCGNLLRPCGAWLRAQRSQKLFDRKRIEHVFFLEPAASSRSHAVAHKFQGARHMRVRGDRDHRTPRSLAMRR